MYNFLKELFNFTKSSSLELLNLFKLSKYFLSKLKLESFILPSGSKSSSFIHLSRSLVRRAERSIVELSMNEEVNTDILKYINRLSDFLFVAARFENKRDGDILWIPNKK